METINIPWKNQAGAPACSLNWSSRMWVCETRARQGLAVAWVYTMRPGLLGSVVSRTWSYCLQILRSYSLLLLLPPSCAAIGSYQFFALTFRKQEAEQMLLVTDRLGRIRHATTSLAQLLDTTVDRMIVSAMLVVPLDTTVDWMIVRGGRSQAVEDATTAVFVLQAGNAIQALDAIIPEPFAQLHQPHFQVRGGWEWVRSIVLCRACICAPLPHCLPRC